MKNVPDQLDQTAASVYALAKQLCPFDSRLSLYFSLRGCVSRECSCALSFRITNFEKHNSPSRILTTITIDVRRMRTARTLWSREKFVRPGGIRPSSTSLDKGGCILRRSLVYYTIVNYNGKMAAEAASSGSTHCSDLTASVPDKRTNILYILKYTHACTQMKKQQQ